MVCIMPWCLACKYNRLPTNFLVVLPTHRPHACRRVETKLEVVKLWRHAIIQGYIVNIFLPCCALTRSKAKYRAFLSVEIVLWLRLYYAERLWLVGKANTHCHLWQSNILCWRLYTTHEYRLMVEKFIESPKPDQPDWLLHLYVTKSLHCDLIAIGTMCVFIF